MQNIDQAELDAVTGGTSKNDQITQQLTMLQTTIKDSLSANNSGGLFGGGGSSQFLLFALLLSGRGGGGGGPAPIPFGPPPAPGPVVNVHTRVRRWF